ncbi:MAG: hypothetical protein PHP28_05210 [Actinomycetota bacterium]|nr:hypothetical protein [Actinomycetota bacterium]MDD5666951.1 hypothetical protein [Actinomycetota bacterium]
MLPYDSFLIDPPWLASLGFLYAKVTDRLYEDADKKARARKFLDLTTLGIFYVTSISLYFNREWTRWIWEMCKAESGRDWMINSGVFHFDHENVSPAGHAVCAALFATYPLALKLGYRLAEGKGCECECGCCAGESEV